MSTLPCAGCGRPLRSQDVVAVRVVVTIERADLAIQPPFEIYELFCASCRLGARDEPAESFDDLFGDVPAWQVRKGRR
jgi:hypothetical protein